MYLSYFDTLSGEYFTLIAYFVKTNIISVIFN